jgi:hypothetical protein
VGTKHTWLRNPLNFGDDQWRDFQKLRKSNLKTARAWALKGRRCTYGDIPPENPLASTARGFRNFQNFVTAIYFHCGKLDLVPAVR